MLTLSRPIFSRGIRTAVLAFAFAISAFAISVDNVVGTPPETRGGYAVRFCARPISGNSTTGHAFVVLDEVLRPGVAGPPYRMARGFYPANPKDIGVNKVPGDVWDEYVKKGVPEDSCRLTVWVSASKFTEIRTAMTEWESKKYQLFNNNCIDFVAAIGEMLDLHLPNRKQFLLPVPYVRALTERNPNAGVRTSPLP